MDNRIYMGLLILMAMPLVEGCLAAKDDRLDWSVAFSLPADTADKTHLGLAGPIVGVHNEVLFIGGGANFPGGMPWRGNIKEYDHALFAYGQDGEGQAELLGVWQLPDTWAYGASCNTPQGVVVAGGENESGLLTNVLLIAWDTETKEPTFRSLPDLPEAITNASLTLLGHMLYFAGGEKQDAVSDELLALDLSQPETGWQLQATLPYPVSHACLIAQADGLYLMGGRKRNPDDVSDFYDGVWHYGLATEEWTARTPLPKARSAATAVALGDGEILFIGGDDGGTFLQVEAAIAAISNEKDTARRSALDAHKIALLEGHPGFGGVVWQYHIGDNTWQRRDEIALATPVTTTATWWQGSLYLPSGEIRAGVRSPDVLVGKWRGVAQATEQKK